MFLAGLSFTFGVIIYVLIFSDNDDRAMATHDGVDYDKDDMRWQYIDW